MSDPMTIAVATAMAGKAVEVAGEPVRAAIAEISRRVRERLRGSAADEEAIVQAIKTTATAELISILEGAIQGLIDEDPDFRDEIETIWRQAQMNTMATGDGVVNIFNGRAERVIQLRDVQGDLNIS
jgi:hypothetical protein